MKGVTLNLVCGEPGVGKSRVAKHIAKQEQTVRLATDEIRKELFGPEPSYTRKESEKTYNKMFERAMGWLIDGVSVVLDATFMLAKGRQRAIELSNKYGVSTEIYRVTCEPATTKSRIRERQQEGSTESDAGIEVYQSIRDRFEPVKGEYHTIDNSGSWSETVEQLEQIEYNKRID